MVNEFDLNNNAHSHFNEFSKIYLLLTLDAIFSVQLRLSVIYVRMTVSTSVCESYSFDCVFESVLFRTFDAISSISFSLNIHSKNSAWKSWFANGCWDSSVKFWVWLSMNACEFTSNCEYSLTSSSIYMKIKNRIIGSKYYYHIQQLVKILSILHCKLPVDYWIVSNDYVMLTCWWK